jgi:hypothetical protein
MFIQITVRVSGIDCRAKKELGAKVQRMGIRVSWKLSEMVCKCLQHESFEERGSRVPYHHPRW